MSARLYVVTDDSTESEYLVCAKTKNGAMDYIAQNVLMRLSAKPATPIDVLKTGSAVMGEADDLFSIGIGDGIKDE